MPLLYPLNPSYHSEPQMNVKSLWYKKKKPRQNVFYMPSIVLRFNSDNLNPYLNTEGEQKTIICNDPFQCKIPVLANFVEL